jgi:hypothetical protein
LRRGLAPPRHTWAFFFDPTAINAGGTATFLMQLRENDGTAFNDGAITVNYPPGMGNDGTFGDPLITEDCTSHGAIITRTAGTNQLIVTNVALAAFTFCDIYVRVTASAFGSYTITIPPGSFSATTPTPTTNIQQTSATLNVVGPVFVTNTADSGTGSLRDAIDTVNSNCGTASAINFNIPGTGPVHDQPGVRPACHLLFRGRHRRVFPARIRANSNPDGANNASIQIDLNAARAPAATASRSSARASRWTACDPLFRRARNPFESGRRDEHHPPATTSARIRAE